ncbi:hypothetical protein [Cupriavidus alkaliphilus]|uniref:Uncharacterized protein n=1 Tax=Cupriavidus alkaliphilus TaxID=942866 RepID=A0A7W4VEA4_9BURK|nr:hypothetical protein [Cupriavidus alkaliphilus]MBB3009994.1 hypothetical protein [Cupriavidus alkaliphilus]
MSELGIQEAFAKYGANLRNVQWSVSAWAPDGSLVVSLWAHHYRRGPRGTAEYADSFERWSGPGNSEFRNNVAHAYTEGSKVRLIVVNTSDTKHVQDGRDASKIQKSFNPREDLVGVVAEIDGDRYVFRFSRTTSPI